MPFITPPAPGSVRRLPAEFEPRGAVYTARPKRKKSWPGCLNEARQQFAYFTDALREVVPVVLIDEDLQINPADIWLRDTGPVWVEESTGTQTRLVLHDFGFNNWGALYPGWESDDQVPRQLAAALGQPRTQHDMILEGGAIESNGQGTLIVTLACLVDERRNPGKDQAAITDALKLAFGLDHVLWLKDGLTGDETGGHVDNITRYLNPNTVVNTSAKPGHPDHAQCACNKTILESARLNVIDLPLPDEPVRYRYPQNPKNSDGLTGTQTLTASYANFLVANGVCFLPTFNQPASDQRAASIIKEASGWDIISIPSHYLLVGGGNLHCLTKDAPPPEATPPEAPALGSGSH